MEVNIRSVPVLWSYSYLFKSADCFPVFELMLALIGKRLPDVFFFVERCWDPSMDLVFIYRRV